jgi:Ca2+-binding EF-hand superfamily protein
LIPKRNRLLKMVKNTAKQASVAPSLKIGVLIRFGSNGLAFLGLEMTDDQISIFHAACDFDGDGSISLEEFTRAVKETQEAREAKMKNTRKGKADEKKKVKSLRDAWSKVLEFLRTDDANAAAVARMFSLMDKSEDGGIDIMELTAGLKIVGIDLTDEEAEQFHTHCDLLKPRRAYLTGGVHRGRGGGKGHRGWESTYGCAYG